VIEGCLGIDNASAKPCTGLLLLGQGRANIDFGMGICFQDPPAIVGVELFGEPQDATQIMQVIFYQNNKTAYFMIQYHEVY
jgi:hypothetical protein